MPKFKDTTSWQQAQLLMQPAFIRILDSIRKQLEESAWRESYQEEMVWPSGTTDEVKELVAQLQEQLAAATPIEAVEIEQVLERLPAPTPVYRLCLQRLDQQFSFDLWELCYQVCFRNYTPLALDLQNLVVEIDTDLIEPDTGDVDWQRLDMKAGKLVAQVFASLPK